jgi:hypothetical protein
MLDKKTIRSVVVPVALLSLLVLATLGCVWHHHAASSETNCSICHLNHQALERPMDALRSPALALISATSDPQEPEFAPGPAILSIPARAPPSA